MLRITVESQTPEETVVKVEGWICEEDAGLLEQECERWIGQARHLALDLNGVRHIDNRGVELLRRWQAERLTVIGGTPYVKALLETCGIDSKRQHA